MIVIKRQICEGYYDPNDKNEILDLMRPLYWPYIYIYIYVCMYVYMYIHLQPFMSIIMGDYWTWINIMTKCN